MSNEVNINGTTIQVPNGMTLGQLRNDESVRSQGGFEEGDIITEDRDGQFANVENDEPVAGKTWFSSPNYQSA